MPHPDLADSEPRPPTVFISYSHDSPEHIERVLAVANRLRADGVDAQIDQYEVSPPEGWPRWMSNRIVAADFVLVVCTEIYARRFDGREEARRGLGAGWEGAILTQELYESPAHNRKLIPVLLSSDAAAHVPIALRAFTRYHLHSEEDYERLYCHLTNQSAVRKPKLGKRRSLAPKEPRQDFLAEPIRRHSGADSAGSSAEELASHHPNEHIRSLSETLEDAYQRKDELESTGREATTVENEILDLRRQIREGGPLNVGDSLCGGRFKLIEPIGSGGFATVWKATDRWTHSLVAVKVLHGQFTQDRTRRERLFRGARKMRELQHQGIVRVIQEQLEDGEYCFFVMEYVSGGDLRQAILAGGLSLRERLRIILDVGAALHLAHQRGVIHRDVKPANILLDSEAQPKLTDFDLVRAADTTGGTRTAGMLGTFLFAAPELMGNPKEATATADVYSLGMTAIFAVYGEDLPPEVFRDAETFVTSLACSSKIRAVLAKAVSWDANSRFDSVADFCRELRQAAFPGVGGLLQTEDPIPAQAVRTPVVKGSPATVPKPSKKASAQKPPKVKFRSEKFAASETLPVIEPPPVVELPPMPPAEKEPSAGGGPPPTKPPAAVKPPVVKKTPRSAEPHSVRTPTPPPMPTARAGRKPQPAAEQAPAVRSPAAPTTPTKPIKAVSPPPAAEAPTPTKPIKAVSPPPAAEAPTPTKPIKAVPPPAARPPGRVPSKPSRKSPSRAWAVKAVPPPTAEAPTPAKPIKAVPPPPAAEAPTPTKPIKAVPPPPAAEAPTPTKPIKAVSPPPAAEAPTPTKPIKAVPPPAARPPARIPSKPSRRSHSGAWAAVLVFVLILLLGWTWIFWPDNQPSPDPAESVDAEPVSRLQVEPAPRYDAQTYGMTGESSDAVESETILAYVRERMDAAEILWESAEYERVAELLDQILLVDPEHERALELSEDIRRRQVRRPQRDRTTVVQESTSADEPTVAVPVQPQRSQVTRKGKLEISFLTHVAEGQVTVHCNRNPIFQETFDFPDIRPFRRQLLKNPERLGTILILPARIVELKVELQLPKAKGDLKTQVRNLSGNLSPQVDRVLQITVTEEYALSVELL